MEITDIISVLRKQYGIDFKEGQKFKNVYKFTDKNKKEYCLKIIKYKFSHFNFILSAILHLQKRGFNKIPNIFLTLGKCPYIKIEEKFAYLTYWISSRQSNYDNPLELQLASQKLGELHKCSEKFIIKKDMKPRVGWFLWEKTFKTRGEEILDFEKRIYQKAYKSEFDILYLSMIKNEIKRVEKTLKMLNKYNYKTIMLKDFQSLGFCHHDYAYHNVLIDYKNEINIIDFDYCILDSNIHDLSSLIIRALKDGKWEIKKTELILESYMKKYRVREEHIPLMSAFIKFPQQFWQVGLQYYWERQPWDEETFMRRLLKYREDIEEREEFLKEFIGYRVVK